MNPSSPLATLNSRCIRNSPKFSANFSSSRCPKISRIIRLISATRYMWWYVTLLVRKTVAPQRLFLAFSHSEYKHTAHIECGGGKSVTFSSLISPITDEWWRTIQRFEGSRSHRSILCYHGGWETPNKQKEHPFRNSGSGVFRVCGHKGIACKQQMNMPVTIKMIIDILYKRSVNIL